MPNVRRSNFTFLKEHDERLLLLGMRAEQYFPDDPNTCILKLRQLSELLTQRVAEHIGVESSSAEPQYELLRRLRDVGILPRDVYQLFDEVRRAGNAASHAVTGDHSSALAILKLSRQIGIWFHRTFRDPSFRSGPFVSPEPPADESEHLRAERDRLDALLADAIAAHDGTVQRLEVTAAELAAAKSEQAVWEQLATETEHRLAEVSRQLQPQPSPPPTFSYAAPDTEPALQSPAPTPLSFGDLVKASRLAAGQIQLDEAETRKLIDANLVQAGWEADSTKLRFALGARPQKGRNLAIAEWPTSSGPADYVLFAGLTPIATIEAKRKNTDVSASLQQAKRYSRDFSLSGDMQSGGGPWGEHRIPFAFSTNGRPFLRQVATLSGIWFADLRRSDNLSYSIDGWYTPEGLVELAKRDEEAAHHRLKNEPFGYGFPIRDYQKEAILAVESAIEGGQREMLLAMATGTGKTKTCVALIYRLLKAQRFRRVLFLVDRSALGEQAANAFKDTRMENLTTFADTFGIKELEEQLPDSETKVHIATVQGMVSRVLNPSEDVAPPPVDAYDCIIVDECHRGYLLDRELSDTELGFRGFDDYVSKYRRVLDAFDAVKIGLTATPALHTTEIFGLPIYTYGYREAVIDGFLIDHEPPVRIETALSKSGIVWKAGESVTVYDPNRSQLDLFTAPDEIRIDVEDFNKRVITEPFNRVVCEYLASELDPEAPGKTLIFCANDAHADLVVDLLKRSFRDRYGSVDDDAVVKITGAADKPLQLIRRYKNEGLPKVAVTVDLLTTGIDVPTICNLVFLRRVNSRILFDQMLGRATRRCDEIGKEVFRVFDAVGLYGALAGMTAMRPVVVNPSISFVQLVNELAEVTSDEERALARDQFLAKLQRKRRHLAQNVLRDFETVAGMPPGAFVTRLKAMTLQEVAKWFTENRDLGEILDRRGPSVSNPVLVSDHADSLAGAERGYGASTKPEDYLAEFTKFIKSHSNDIPAIVTVLTRPRELTRKQLRELALELDRAGFSETSLETAWREMTNQDMAARIVGFIRQAALGDALIPYDQRVDAGLARLLASHKWTTPQREWLKKIAAQTKANVLVDREALDDPDLLFRQQGGGFARLNRIFDGKLADVLDEFNEALWTADGSREAG